jgi:Ni/Fe-hydrogenase 1 B-type cytochrome subunit
VPSTWNAGPRDARGTAGPYESALLGTPVADPEQPLEILRTIHSFDPCMACGVHVVDARGREIVKVKAVLAPSAEDRVPVYVWDLVVRSTHWLIALSIVVLSVTGIYIGRPFIEVQGPASQRFVMGWVKVVHSYSAIVFSLAVGSRLVWMFLGPRYARWNQFVPTTRKRIGHMWGTFKFYVFLARKPPATIGHNALAGATYVAVFGLYLVMIATGLALYSVSAYTSYMKMWSFLLPIFGGAQTTRWIHHVVMWLLIGFTVHHFFSGLLMAKVEKTATLDSIFSGYKYVPKQEVEEEKHGK